MFFKRGRDTAASFRPRRIGSLRISSRKAADGAVSDIVGTTVLLGVTVVIVAAATVAFSGSNNAQATPPALELRANATADSTASGFVTLRHAGGASMPAGALEAVVSTTSWSERVPITGAFELDDTLHVPTTRAYAAGERLEVLLYAGSALVGATTTSVAAASASAASSPVFVVQVTDPATSGVSHAAGSTFHLSALVSHADGRRAVQDVHVDLSTIGGGATTPMYDDGAHGDDVAGDGNYSTYVFVPPGAAAGSATLSVHAVDFDGFAAPSAATVAITVTTVSNGAPGAQGPQGVQGIEGSNGDAGTHGVNGNPAGTLPPTSDPMPVISDVDPDSGAVGTIVTITGSYLTNVSGVTMAIPGPVTTKYPLSFAWAPDEPAGTKLLVTIPNVPTAGNYVFNVTRYDTAYANSPAFRYDLLVPEVTGVNPASGRAYEQVLVSGKNFTGAASVRLSNTTHGSFAMPWAFVSDNLLAFITHPGLKPGKYDVTVTNSGNDADTLPQSFEFLAALDPSTLTIDPDAGDVGDIITVYGQNLGAVTRLTLRDPMVVADLTDDVVVDTTWWYTEGTLKFKIPVAAAPPALTPREWLVNLSASYGDPVEVPEILTVNVVPPPTVDCPLAQVSGQPFSQVDIHGTSFINVQSVYFETVAVVWAPVDETHLIAITHTGMTPGDYRVHVTTATGDAWSSCTYHSDPLKLIPVYDKTVFEYVGVVVNVRDGTGGDEANVTVNVKMKDPMWSVVNTTSQGQTDYPTDFIPDQVSNSNNAPVDIENAMNCKTTHNTPVYVLSSGYTKMNQYDSTVFTLRFYLELTVKQGTATNSPTETYRVVTNDISQYFIVSPNTATTEVSDHVFPNGVWTCST